MDLISVIIPIYNLEQYIERCVRSVMAQSYTNLQIILVDDGSSDGSGAVCDALAQKDSRIKVIHKPNGGVSDARNFGVKAPAGNLYPLLTATIMSIRSLSPRCIHCVSKTSAGWHNAPLRP